MSDRGRFVEALGSGRTREAGRIAVALARAGGWDDLVAAAIHLHAPAQTPERAAATAWIEAGLAAAVVAAEPGDEQALCALFDALIDAGRLADMFTGLQLCREEGLLTQEVLGSVGRALLGHVLALPVRTTAPCR